MIRFVKCDFEQTRKAYLGDTFPRSKTHYVTVRRHGQVV
jgi:hypothetical protein